MYIDPLQFHINLVDELNPIYVITVDGRNTRDEEHLVYAGHEEAQKWVAIYWQPQNAFTITKFNTNETWTEPDRRDLGKLGQICIEAVTGINHYYPHPRQLFRFKLVQGHKLPSGNYRIRSLISNQPLGIQPVTWHGPGYPAVVPVAGAAPQTCDLIHLTVRRSASKRIRGHLPH
ncbi:hypothetical protein EDC04DRAFT_1634962 [Pisolithus marmoratus]|nr:hypothetical protein EDC04DRAFT_1634962 [Pisolithus marmoratus]